MTTFIIKRAKEFEQTHRNVKMYLPEEKMRKTDETPKAVQVNLAKVSFSHSFQLKNTVREFTVSKVWLDSELRMDYAAVAYNPFPKDHPKAAPPNHLNVFSNSIVSPAEVESCTESPLPWLDLLYRLVGENVDHYYNLLNYFTHIAYQPYVKLGIMPSLFGPQGNGKTLLIMTWGWGFQYNFLYFNNDIKVLKNSNLLENKLIVYFDEAGPKEKGDEAFFKGLLSNDGRTLYLKRLYHDPSMQQNCLNIISTSNKKEAFHKEAGDRRYWLLNTDHIHQWQSFGQKKAYFHEFVKWMEKDNFSGAKAVMKYLYSRIPEMLNVFHYGPHEDNTNLVEDDEQLELSSNSADQFVQYIVHSGANITVTKEIWMDLEQLHPPKLQNERNKFATEAPDELRQEWKPHCKDMSDARMADNHIHLEQREIWVQFITQDYLMKQFLHWCEVNNEYQVSWKILKKSLIAAKVGEFDKGLKGSVRKDITKDNKTETIRTQPNFHVFYPIGLARANANAYYSGRSRREPKQQIRPQSDDNLDQIRAHNLPYFLWSERVSINNNNHDDLSASQDQLSQSALDPDDMYLCTHCRIVQNTFSHRPYMANGYKFCSEKCAIDAGAVKIVIDKEDAGDDDSSDEEPLF